MRNIKKTEQGYIALMSAIILSAILAVLTAAAGFSGYFARFNELDAEYKQRSASLAASCINTALLRLAEDPRNTRPGQVVVGTETCDISAILVNVPAANQLTVEAVGTVRQSVSSIRAVVDLNNFSLVSWNEFDSS